jgi:hypothetical protein
MVFPAGKQPSDYAALELGEAPGPAGAPFDVKHVSGISAELEAEVPLDPVAACHRVRCAKHFRFRPVETGFTASAAVQLALVDGDEVVCRVGIELVVNLLAPASSDRYIAFGAERQPLGWQGVVRGESVRFVDEWRRVATEIVAPGAAEFWIAPIETVSESEDGFERVYQGSQILAVWPLDMAPGREIWQRLRRTTTLPCCEQEATQPEGCATKTSRQFRPVAPRAHQRLCDLAVFGRVRRNRRMVGGRPWPSRKSCSKFWFAPCARWLSSSRRTRAA